MSSRSVSALRNREGKKVGVGKGSQNHLGLPTLFSSPPHPRQVQ